MLTSARPKLIGGVGFLLAAGLVLVPPGAEARMNLPQRRQVVTLREDAAHAVRAYFAQRAQPELAPPIEQLLTSSLPADFRQACADVTEGWGSEVAGSEVWRVRLLSWQPRQAWLTFRCGSRRSDLSQYYDERLAVLHFDPTRLVFLPIGEDYENDTTLFHVEFGARLTLENGEALAFRVASSNDNPCCGGPEAISEERLMLFADSPQGIRKLLSLLTHRQHDSHDDVDGDTQTLYRADVTFEKDSQARVTSVVAAFREEEKDVTWNGSVAKYHTRSQRTGTLRCRWNPARFQFEEIK
jgi:hypothetical protein